MKNLIKLFCCLFPWGSLTIEELHTDSYQSRSRNKLVTEAFYLTGEIEKYGSGYIRVREEIKNYPTMKFEYQEIGDGYLVTLSYSKQKITTQETTQETLKQKSTKDKIVDILRQDGTLNRDNLAQKVNVSSNAVKQHLANLKKENIIKRVGSTKSGYWEVLVD